MDTELEKIRYDIDQIDDQIAALFVKRMSLVKNIAKQKQQNSLPIQNISREQKILSRITKDMPNPTATYLKTLFTAIFEISCLSQQHFLESTSKP